MLDELQKSNKISLQVDIGIAAQEWQMEGNAELLPSGGVAEASSAEVGPAAAIRS
jgi:hypothetical protein